MRNRSISFISALALPLAVSGCGFTLDGNHRPGEVIQFSKGSMLVREIFDEKSPFGFATAIRAIELTAFQEVDGQPKPLGECSLRFIPSRESVSMGSASEDWKIEVLGKASKPDYRHLIKISGVAPDFILDSCMHLPVDENTTYLINSRQLSGLNLLSQIMIGENDGRTIEERVTGAKMDILVNEYLSAKKNGERLNRTRVAPASADGQSN